MTVVHNIAKEGFGTGTNELYDRARPSYQPGVLAHVRQAVRGSAPLNVVEIGAGTGISTRALLAHPDWADSINELRAIEPSEGMRLQFSKNTKDPRVSVREGTFDTTNIEDGWADVIIIAQAFHWCPDYDKAAAEFARILKPDGLVALIWNLEDRNRAAWVAQIRDRFERHEGGSPQFRLGLWRATFSTPSYQANFAPPEENVWDYVLPGNKEIVVNRACSKSYIAILPPDQKQSVVDDISAIIDRKDGMTWIEEDKGIFEYPYQTFVIIAKKK